MNSRIAFYRKYRPKNFSEIIGQKFVIKTLTNSIIKNKKSHAYIFSGPKGVGKTSIAKIFSKAVNCLESDNGDCCNKCDNCILIDKGQAVDVVELDAASNNGVGEVRNIIDTVGYLPNSLKYKVYIIDEAHMLSNAAWNAFLKLVEDPPEYLIFIFATTEPYKFPPTIISRCQRYNFLKLNNLELKEYLLKISEKENIKIDDSSLNKISELSDGSLRDGCSLLDQLDSYTNSNIKEKDIYDVFGLLDVREKISLLKSIWNGDFEKIISLIEEYEINGIDFYQLSLDLINILYDKLVYERTKNFSLLKFLPANEVNFIEIQPKYIVKCLDIWQENINKIKTSSNQKFFFKLSCFDSSRLFEFDSTVNLTNNSNNLKKDEIKAEKIVEMISNNQPEKNISNISNEQPVDNSKDSNKISNDENIIDFGHDEKVVPNIEKLDVSNFKKVRLDDVEMRIVKIKKDSVEHLNVKNDDSSQIDNKNEVSDEKINIVDSYIDDFIKVSHIDKDENINDVFSIISKNNYKNKKKEITLSKTKTNKKDSELINKENIFENEKKNKIENITKKEVLINENEINKNGDDITLFGFGDIEEIKEEPLLNNVNKIFDVEKNENEEKQRISNSVKKKTPEIKKEINNDDKQIIGNNETFLTKDEIEQNFLKIAVNTDVKEKEKVYEFFSNLKSSIPIDKNESILKDLDKILVVSKNGIAFLSNDKISIKNLNETCTTLDFLSYIKNKFNKLYLVIAVNKEQAIEIGNKIKKDKLSSAIIKDVDISFLNEKMKTKKTAKDIAEDIFKDLIIDEE